MLMSPTDPDNELFFNDNPLFQVLLFDVYISSTLCVDNFCLLF